MNNLHRKLTFVFDLDNTLIKTNMANNLAYKDAVKRVLKLDLPITNKVRLTREKLCAVLAPLSSEDYYEVIENKEKIFPTYIGKTSLNKSLVSILKTLYLNGCETILLTNSHKQRALQLCSYYNIGQYFYSFFFNEESHPDKYTQLTENGYDLNSIILFENDIHSMLCAKKSGIPMENIIKVKF